MESTATIQSIDKIQVVISMIKGIGYGNAHVLCEISNSANNTSSKVDV